MLWVLLLRGCVHGGVGDTSDGWSVTVLCGPVGSAGWAALPVGLDAWRRLVNT